MSKKSIAIFTLIFILCNFLFGQNLKFKPPKQGVVGGETISEKLYHNSVVELKRTEDDSTIYKLVYLRDSKELALELVDKTNNATVNSFVLNISAQYGFTNIVNIKKLKDRDIVAFKFIGMKKSTLVSKGDKYCLYSIAERKILLFCDGDFYCYDDSDVFLCSENNKLFRVEISNTNEIRKQEIKTEFKEKELIDFAKKINDYYVVTLETRHVNYFTKFLFSSPYDSRYKHYICRFKNGKLQKDKRLKSEWFSDVFEESSDNKIDSTNPEAVLVSCGYQKTRLGFLTMEELQKKAFIEIVNEDYSLHGHISEFNLNIRLSNSDTTALIFHITRFDDWAEYPVLLAATILNINDEKYVFYKINYNLDFFYMDFIDSETQEVETVKMFY